MISLAIAMLLFSAPAPEGTLSILAAASLKEVFTEVGKRFESEYRGIKVQISFAGSQQLVSQIRLGAPADVLACADEKSMDQAVKTGRVDKSTVVPFARNRLTVITPRLNPAHLQSWADIAKPGITLVLADKSVPAGRYALAFLEHWQKFSPGVKDKVLPNVKSFEDNVRAALNKVALGEADASVVYRTDAQSAGKAVQSFGIPSEYNVLATYPAAPVSDSHLKSVASVFVSFLKSRAARQILAEHGFLQVR